MGYQETWMVVQPQSSFNKFMKAYERALKSGYYETEPCCATPRSVVVLKQGLENLPARTKALWICGDRCFHNPQSVFGDFLRGTSMCSVKFIPVEELLLNNPRMLEHIDLDSTAKSENTYMTRYDPRCYAQTILRKHEPER